MSRWSREAVRRALELYLVMGSANCGGRPPGDIVQAAIAGGITLFQFREKGSGALAGDDRLALCLELRDICRAGGIPFIVNDDLQLAIEADADGLHVGQEDRPAAAIRASLGPDKLLGVSAHTLEEAQQAIADGADYLGIGPVYPTGSKADALPPQGTSLLQRLRASGISAPLAGIGGITPSNASTVRAAGADGIAVISAIAGTANPALAAASFLVNNNRPPLV